MDVDHAPGHCGMGRAYRAIRPQPPNLASPSARLSITPSARGASRGRSGEQVDDTEADEQQQKEREGYGGPYFSSDAPENADIDAEAEGCHRNDGEQGSHFQ